MSRLSGSIHTLRAGLVEAINAAGLPPCIPSSTARASSGRSTSLPPLTGSITMTGLPCRTQTS